MTAMVEEDFKLNMVLIILQKKLLCLLEIMHAINAITHFNSKINSGFPQTAFSCDLSLLEKDLPIY